MEEPEAAKYLEWHQVMEHLPAFISITLYDMSESEPIYLTRTYSGTNSIQGYGARGGQIQWQRWATRVSQWCYSSRYVTSFKSLKQLINALYINLDQNLEVDCV